MDGFIIRPFEQADTQTISTLICRALREVNSRDYPAEEIERLVRQHTPGEILRMSQTGWMFTATKEGQPLGVLRLLPSGKADRLYWLRTVFVSPTHHGLGIGRMLVENGERTARKAGGERLCLCSSLTAHAFYQKLGYRDQTSRPDEDGLYPMEKFL